MQFSVQALSALTPTSICAVIVSIVLAASRLAPFTKPYWSLLPKKLQAWLPSIVAGLPLALSSFSAVKTWMDFAQALLVVGVIPLALAVPGMSSPHNHPDPAPADKLPPPPKPPTGLAAASLFLVCLSLTGCGLFAVAAPYLAEAAVVISDAVNAVDAAQALLPSLHLAAAEEAKAEQAIAKARLALAAAAAADSGAKELTNEQLDASLAAFRQAWADLQGAFSAHAGAELNGAALLPEPLAVKRVRK